MPAKFVLIGKSKKRTNGVRDILSSVEPNNIPVRLLADIFIFTDESKYKLNKKTLKDPVTIESIKQSIESLYIKEPIEKIEVVIDLDTIEEEICSKTKSWLSMYFDE